MANPPTLTFKLIHPGKRSLEPDQDKAFLRSIPITFAVCAIAVWWDLLWLLMLLPPLALVLQLLGIPRKLRSDWPKGKDVVGELRVDEQGLIQIRDGDEAQIPYKNIRSALLEHNHIKGEPLGPKDILHNGIATLTITMKSGEQEMIKFLVENRDQVPAMEHLLRTMYKLGIPLREFAGRLRLKTILFKHGRSYADIQALKKDLGVGGFY